MSQLTLEAVPMQLSELLDIHEVEALNEKDYDCLAEVREVLKKYDKRERFGVTLLHKHFDLDSDEVLMEYTDVKARTQTIIPVKKSDVSSSNSIETNWYLADGNLKAMLSCQQYCANNIHGNHDRFHK